MLGLVSTVLETLSSSSVCWNMPDTYGHCLYTYVGDWCYLSVNFCENSWCSPVVNQHSQSCITWDSWDANCCRIFSHCCLMTLPWTMLVGTVILLLGLPYLCKIVGIYTCLRGFFHPVVYVACCFSQYFGVFEVHAVPCLDDLSSSNSCLQPSPTGCVCPVVCHLESSMMADLGPTWAVAPLRKNSCL